MGLINCATCGAQIINRSKIVEHNPVGKTREPYSLLASEQIVAEKQRIGKHIIINESVLRR